ncbi:hypothetical protein [Methylococcus geothermalis]|uniref:Uncharacterized protein n=1 Tax=Methylococcus geothermalis TaxID=2681310 RepID=A0A858QAW8_9GAMM|nr:hypothetical protein [Methylococcus geothermalis]QJD31038.1 hypothetical protein GNH96_14515 [Methylococcus geothermalis]
MAKKVVPITSKPRGPTLSLVSATEEKSALSPEARTPPSHAFRDYTKSGSPVAEGLFAKAVYRSVYCLSFGVVLSALVLGKLIPGRRLIAKGLQDGTMAARQSLNWFETQRDVTAPGMDESGLKA